MKVVRVAVGVLENSHGEILLSQRHKNQHLGGLWEFPGGKIEPGETISQALARELSEELGIALTHCEQLISIEHAYPDKLVRLEVFRVDSWQGEARGMEDQRIKWTASNLLSRMEMPEADRPIISAINLPASYVICPPTVTDFGHFLSGLERTLEKGHKLIQFRVFGLAETDKEKLAREALVLCHSSGAQMLINADLKLALLIGADGVHVNRRQLFQGNLTDLVEFNWVGASCHGGEELSQALRMGADFATLSPVLPTPSHPDANTLGWDSFSELIESFPMPVYSMGGMSSKQVSRATSCGAQGIAGIRGLWG